MREDRPLSLHDAPRTTSVTPELIQSRLEASPSVDPELAALMAQIELRPAAVLLPLLRVDSLWHILFTRRSQRVSAHKGEISFPGGRIDPEDPHPEAAALRETHEEIGIPTTQIRVLGRLPESFSIAGYRISPFVGHLQQEHSFTPNPYEIDEIFIVPLRDLLAPGVLHLYHRVRAGEHEHDVYVFRWRETHAIWGATARILKTFLEQVFGPLPVEVSPSTTTLELPAETQARLQWRTSSHPRGQRQDRSARTLDPSSE